jgi:large subunit ribosomal protein L18
MVSNRDNKRKVRHRRVRAKIVGTTKRPRLSVFKSNKFIYAQVIDDGKANTLVAFDSKSIKDGTAREKAQKVGEEVAKLAKAKKIDTVVFDRGGYIYTGVVKALAEGARKGGLKF